MNLVKPLIYCISVFMVACAPLQQAPLLYSSKTTVGLDISTSTTETPGGSISIGVKVVDAAYVPVAVSKKLRDDANNKDIVSEIIRIEAVFGEGSTAGKLDSLTEENKVKIRDFLNAKIFEEKLSDDLKRLEQGQATRAGTIESVKLDIKRIEKESESLSTDAADEKRIKNQKELSDARRRLDEISIQQAKETELIDSRKKEVQVAKANSDKLFAAAAEAASFLRTDKRDAMSVYGRFNADTAAGASSSPTASLTAGKIFSTGVASQNLTEAAKLEALYGSLARCLENVNKLAAQMSVAKRDELISKVETICTQKVLKADK